MKTRTKRVLAAGWVVGLVIAIVWFYGARAANPEVRLADGSYLRIYQVVFGEHITCNFPNGNQVQRALGRVTPKWLSPRLPESWRPILMPGGGSSLSMSGDGKTCLFIITARSRLPATGELDLQRLVIGDEHGQGTNFAEHLTMVGSWNRFQGWAAEDFPKDSKTLRIRCLAAGKNGGLAEAAEFTIPNPACGQR